MDLDARYAIPEDVVRRVFPEETIILNLGTGQYYGLNATATEMVEKLVDGATPRAAAGAIAAGSGTPLEQVEADLGRLLAELAERRLIAPDG